MTNPTKEILNRLEETASLLLLAYNSQHTERFEDFVENHLRKVLPQRFKNISFVVEIIAEIARAKLLGIPLSSEEKKQHELIIKENLSVLLEDTSFPLPERLEKFREYGIVTLMKTADIRRTARTIIKLWKQEGGDLDEFLAEHSRCKCGECNPFDKVGDIFSEVIISMCKVELKNRTATDKEIEHWIKEVKKAVEIQERKELINDINLN